MRLLILFSMWAPDISDNSKRWLDYYKSILNDRFKNDDKFISINGNRERITSSYLDGFDNLLGVSNVPPEMVINSDASGYQYALIKCHSILNKYDAICFFHTKGISYDFDFAAGIRAEIERSIFDRDRLLDGMRRREKTIVAIKGHASPSSEANERFINLAKTCGISGRHVNYCATLTLFSVSSDVLIDLLNCLPYEIKRKNLLEAGQDRYFFEAAFPSLLSAKGAAPIFLCGQELQPGLNHRVSFDAYPAHNSAIVIGEFDKTRQFPNTYFCHAIPYIFGQPDEVKNMTIVFG